MFTSLITPEELNQHITNTEWCVVDCRFELLQPDKGWQDYRKSHLPAAVYAHLDNDLASPITPNSGRHPLPSAAEFVATLERLGISNGTQVVVYDAAGGGIAARLWWMLRWLGHEAVAVLDGGYAAWTAAGFPTESTVPAPDRGRFSPQAREDWVLTTSELARKTASGSPLALVDAREAARFLGEQEPIDSAAGIFRAQSITRLRRICWKAGVGVAKMIWPGPGATCFAASHRQGGLSCAAQGSLLATSRYPRQGQGWRPLGSMRAPGANGSGIRDDLGRPVGPDHRRLPQAG